MNGEGVHEHNRMQRSLRLEEAYWKVNERRQIYQDNELGAYDMISMEMAGRPVKDNIVNCLFLQPKPTKNQRPGDYFVNKRKQRYLERRRAAF